MSNYQSVQNPNGDENHIRDIHPLTPSNFPHNNPLRSSLSIATSDQNSRIDFSNMSSNNSTLVLAGSLENLSFEGEEDIESNTSTVSRDGGQVCVTSVKKDEVLAKINAWKNAKISEINNRFKCEDAIINGWESEQAQKSTLRMKKVERKLEDKLARAVEKMENEIAKAHQKAQERRASAQGKRGTKIARVLEVANFMKAVGRSPVKNSF